MEKIFIGKLTLFVYDLTLHQQYDTKQLSKTCALFLCSLFDTSLTPLLNLIVEYLSVFALDFIFLLEYDLQCTLPNMSYLGKLLSYCVTSVVSFRCSLAIMILCVSLLLFGSSHGFDALIKALHLLANFNSCNFNSFLPSSSFPFQIACFC